MFRIECFVEDARLVQVLHALAGKVKAMDVQPVVNATVDKSNGELKAITPGSVIDLFAKYLKENQEPVTVDYLRAFLGSIGRSPTSTQYVLRQAIERKLITKHGKGNAMTYERTKSK
jgi:xanthine dehydrogenase iron-sulfur cluster and FAD-binding subunit A